MSKAQSMNSNEITEEKFINMLKSLKIPAIILLAVDLLAMVLIIFEKEKVFSASIIANIRFTLFLCSCVAFLAIFIMALIVYRRMILQNGVGEEGYINNLYNKNLIKDVFTRLYIEYRTYIIIAFGISFFLVLLQARIFQEYLIVYAIYLLFNMIITAFGEICINLYYHFALSNGQLLPMSPADKSAEKSTITVLLVLYIISGLCLLLWL